MNVLYDFGRQGLSDGSINWATDTIRAVLLDFGMYTPNPSIDANLSDIPSGARIATSAPLSGKSNVKGVFFCDPFVFSSVSGASCEAVAIIKDTGTTSTSRLIGLIDTATGLPVTPIGNDIQANPDAVNGLFKI